MTDYLKGEGRMEEVEGGGAGGEGGAGGGRCTMGHSCPILGPFMLHSCPIFVCQNKSSSLFVLSFTKFDFYCLISMDAFGCTIFLALLSVVPSSYNIN